MRKFVLYLSKYCPVLPFKTRVKSPKLHNSRGKSARANWSFHGNFNTVSSFSHNRGKLFLHFQKAGVNSQSSKNRGKIIISLQNRGNNAKAPTIIMKLGVSRNPSNVSMRKLNYQFLHTQFTNFLKSILSLCCHMQNCKLHERRNCLSKY